jgi:hypothetical protein
MNPKNPFYVLDLSFDAAPAEIERQGRKLLGMFELGVTKARRYECPMGAFERDATMVREAMAALRDPKRRAREVTLGRLLGNGSDATSDDDPDAPLRDAFLVGGYRGF